MWGDALLALGLLLSTASQLRISGSPIGPGEICLVIWLFLMLGREVGRLGPPLTPALSRLLIFWLLFALGESLGAMTGFVIGDKHDPQWVLHDVMAYPLLAGVSCLSVVEPNAGPRLHRVAALLVVLGTTSLAVQLANAQGLFAMPPIDPWYWDRLRGASANPDQLALFCAALALTALHLIETAARTSLRIAAVACLAIAAFAGKLTGSDTFTIVIVVAGPIFFAIKVRTWLASSAGNLTFRAAFAGIVVFALPVMLAAAVPLALGTAFGTEQLVAGLAKNGGKEAASEADLRLELWREAIGRGVESGTLGLGPGPHLNIPASLVGARQSEHEPEMLQHPVPNGIPNFEAHNTVLDLFTQGGLIAALSFLWLVTTALLMAYRARSAGLTTLLAGVILFGMTTLIVRQPLFWFAIALCLVAAERNHPAIRATELELS
jgi:O-antigen ligase